MNQINPQMNSPQPIPLFLFDFVFAYKCNVRISNLQTACNNNQQNKPHMSPFTLCYQILLDDAPDITSSTTKF